MAAAIDYPQELVDALGARKTQVIPFELMATVGIIFTYAKMLRGEDLLFFVDSRSV